MANCPVCHKVRPVSNRLGPNFGKAIPCPEHKAEAAQMTWRERLAWGAPTHPTGRLDANMIVWGITYIAWWQRMRRGAG